MHSEVDPLRSQTGAVNINLLIGEPLGALLFQRNKEDVDVIQAA